MVITYKCIILSKPSAIESIRVHNMSQISAIGLVKMLIIVYETLFITLKSTVEMWNSYIINVIR